jgi:hypothetical protein
LASWSGRSLAWQADLEQGAEVERYLAVMDQLSGEALTPAATVLFIEQVAKDT